jgi:hypothetical protein
MEADANKKQEGFYLGYTLTNINQNITAMNNATNAP